MPKKNQKLRKLVEEIEPFEPPAKSTESGSPEQQAETVAAESKPQEAEESVEVSSEVMEVMETSNEESDSTPDQVPAEIPDAPASPEQDFSEEDLLGDVRQSLIEEESIEKEKPAKWWRKIGKGRKKDKVSEPVPEEEIELPVTELSIGAIGEQEEHKESEEYLEQIDELIDMLEPTAEAEFPLARVDEEVAAPSETVPKVDIEELKKQAFQPRTADEEAENSSDVRAIALE